MSTLEECNTLVSELTVAYLVTGGLGDVFTGENLHRFRQLPAKERAYFAALVAPLEDPHAATRTQTVSEPDEFGRRTVTYDPPLPQACECHRPVFRDYARRAVRCGRCLKAWPDTFSLRGMNDELRMPLIDSVDRADMGHAIDVKTTGQVGKMPNETDTEE
jgi:hypothetical protein